MLFWTPYTVIVNKNNCEIFQTEEGLKQYGVSKLFKSHVFWTYGMMNYYLL